MNNIDMEQLQAQAQQEQAKKQAQAQVTERREFILDQILEPDARERLKRLAIVKAEQAVKISDSLCNAATSGQLTQKITDAGLKKMLETGVGADGKSLSTQPKIKIQRRKFDSDDSDDNDDDLL